MKFELKLFNQNISDSELLDDLTKVAKELNRNSLGKPDYDNSATKRFSSSTIAARFNGWNNALQLAGLEINRQINIQENDLMENIEAVWLKLGRQPGRRDMTKLNSKYSERPYIMKYGSWNKALEKFITYINDNKSDNKEFNEVKGVEIDINGPLKNQIKHTTKRTISNRLKVMVLIRDGNKCRLCGIKVIGQNIHFDHIIPWSKGGETTLDNIQVLCAQHNLAKGNYYESE